MNGIHDMGGMHGFGPVQRDENEPVFHEAWEGRVLGMLRAFGARFPTRTPGGTRDIIERIEPARYLSMSYYERFLEVVRQRALAEGVIAPGELEQREKLLAKQGEAAKPRRGDPAAVDRVREGLRRQPRPAPNGSPPRFALGDAVVARNINWPGHNRLPRYIKGKRGSIVRVNGCYEIEDANAGALGPNPQTVYTVRFEGREVWGAGGDENMSVHLELWEGYLEPASSESQGAKE